MEKKQSKKTKETVLVSDLTAPVFFSKFSGKLLRSDNNNVILQFYHAEENEDKINLFSVSKTITSISTLKRLRDMLNQIIEDVEKRQ